MMLPTDLQTVAFAAVRLDDEAFVVTRGRSCDVLARAIERAGLVCPPVLQRLPGRSGYRVVCGFLRIQALRRLGRAEAPARVLRDGAADRAVLELSLCDNLGHRQFNAAEQAAAVSRLMRCMPEAEVLDAWLPLLGLAPSVKALDACLRVDGLEDGIRQALAAGAITAHSAAALAGLAAGDRQALFGLFTAVHLSASKQAEIIETSSDLARRDGISIRDVLSAPGIAAVLDDPDPNLSQKGERIRSLLHRRRFPRLTRKQERFDDLAKQLPRAGGVRLVPPPSFEGGTYRLEISFSRPDTLAGAAATVQALSRDERLAGLLDDGR